MGKRGPPRALKDSRRYLFVSSNVDNTLSLPTSAKTMSLFSTADGPSEHVGPIR
jgi:hypothetical protein